jgi:hypothetical protein
MGTFTAPPVMYKFLAAEFTIWSMACMAKFQVMNSTMGRKPRYAAPTAKPVNPASVMGLLLLLLLG